VVSDRGTLPIDNDQAAQRKGKRSDLGKNLIPAQRRRLIHEYLQRQKIVRSATLSEVLGASEATVRRDLDWLERQGIAERTHGGAILSQRLPTEPAYASSALANPEAKRAIGHAAADLVNDGDTVFINSGTTTTEVLLSLMRRSDIPNLTLVTNNVTAAVGAREAEFEVILLGGSFRLRSYSTVGHFATEMLRGMHANKTFIGVDGISLKYHYTTPTNPEAEIGHVMIEQTQGPVYVVADASKWGVVSNFLLATLDEVDGLIVNDGLDPDARSELSHRGIGVIVASPDDEGLMPHADPHEEGSYAPVLKTR
jgi:DeoR family fructose operon transcriptional repressor